MLAAGLLCPPTRGDEPPAIDRLVGTRVGDFRLPNVVTGDETWFYGLAMMPKQGTEDEEGQRRRPRLHGTMLDS